MEVLNQSTRNFAMKTELQVKQTHMANICLHAEQGRMSTASTGSGRLLW